MLNLKIVKYQNQFSKLWSFESDRKKREKHWERHKPKKVKPKTTNSGLENLKYFKFDLV